MDFVIPCDAYARLAEVPGLNDPNDTRKHFNSIYLERRNNIVVAVATNIKIAAIEKIGEQDGPDECIAIAIDDKLRIQCETEKPFDGMITITHNPMLAFTVIKTTLGFSTTKNMNVALPEDHEFADWRNWFPDAVPALSSGNMSWDGEAIATLSNASVTGQLIFPTFIDCSKPVVIRDATHDDWFGLFNPSHGDDDVVYKEMPDWIE